MAVEIHPRRIKGLWKEGWVLDYHSEHSEFVGHDAYGHPKYETTRTPVGELLYRLKYRGNQEVVGELVQVAAGFVKKWSPPLEAVVPVPPSKQRVRQPVLQLAQGLSAALGLSLRDVVIRRSSPKQLKDVHDFDERTRLLENAHEVDDTSVARSSFS